MKYLVKTSLLLALFFTLHLNAQIFSSKDSAVCMAKFKLADNSALNNKPIGDVITAIGKSFIGTDYAEHTLEVGQNETLVINLTGVDCTTFLEYSLALARCIKEKNESFIQFEKELSEIRYRNGKINQYPSRLHYFSDWIYDNELKGIIKNISGQIGGSQINFNVNFMSLHPNLYPRLKEHPEFIGIIEKQEKDINKRDYTYIPKENVAEIENKIKNGDLIAITSGIKGLDVNHVGIAVRMEDGRIHLLHAPNVGSKVQINKMPIAEYLSSIKKDTGIMVLRALEPK